MGLLLLLLLLCALAHPARPRPPPPPQGGATAAAAGAATAEAVRQKEAKINELIEELGNKELLLSEAQAQLAAVRRAGGLPLRLRAAAAARACLGPALLPPADALLLCLPTLVSRLPLSSPPQTATARKELEELRELKEDVERREKAQAEVIGQQAKRLEELDALYRDEAIMRKKIFNQVG